MGGGHVQLGGCAGYLLCAHPTPLSLLLYLLSAHKAALCGLDRWTLPIPLAAAWQEIRRGEAGKSEYWVKGWLCPSCQSHGPLSGKTLHFLKPLPHLIHSSQGIVLPTVLGQDTALSLWVPSILSHIYIDIPLWNSPQTQT